MRCKRVSAVSLAVDAAQWGQSERQSIDMIATPLAMQPTGYVVKSWTDKPFGRVTKLDVEAVHDGSTFALRLSWEVPAPTEKGKDNDFPPAVAFALPVKGVSPLVLMGTAEAPIHILRWQGGRHAGVRSIVAKGIGTSDHAPDVGQKGTVKQEGLRFTVVMTRALGSGAGAAPLKPGATTKIGFAAWDGGNEERAGIKSFSVDWVDLALDA